MPHVATLQKTVGAVPTNITTIWSLIGLRKHQDQWLLELTALRVVAFLALVAVFGSLVAVVAIPLALIVGVPALLFGVPIFLFVGLPLFLFVGLPFLCIVGVPLGVVAACALLAAVVGLISFKAFALPLPPSRGRVARRRHSLHLCWPSGQVAFPKQFAVLCGKLGLPSNRSERSHSV